MPSRLIREGILTSDRVDMLSDAAEVFYRRLMSKVDDHGLFDARPSVLAAACYPLRVRDMTDSQVATMLAECVMARLAAVYWHSGKPYVHMLDTKWQVRSASRFPLPSESDGVQSDADVYKCLQVHTNVYLVVDVVLDVGVGVVVGNTKPNPPSGEGGALTVAPLPKTLTPATWAMWKSHLANKGKGITPQAEKLQLVRLAAFDDPEHVVRETIEKGRVNLPPVGGYESEKPKPPGAADKRQTVADAIFGAQSDDPASNPPIDISGESTRIA